MNGISIVSIIIGIFISFGIIGIYFVIRNFYRERRFQKLSSASITETIHPTKLIIGSETNPDIEISRFQPSKHTKYIELDVDKNLKTNLSAIMQQAPNLVANIANIVSPKYLLKFSPQIAQGLANGSYNLMGAIEGGIRGIAVDASGKIIGQGTLQSVSKAPAVALAIWQVAAIITAQKYLSDINKQLRRIEVGIQDIKEFLENERLGKIGGNYEYLQNIATRLQNGNFTDTECKTFDNQIEHIERENLQIMATLKIEMEDLLNRVKNQDLTGWGLRDNFETAKNILSDYKNSVRTSLMCIQVRTITAISKCALPVDQQLSKSRLEDLSESLDKIDSHKGDFYNEGFYLSSFWGDFFGDSEILQAELDDQIEEFNSSTNKSVGQIRVLISKTEDTIERQLVEFEKPISLEVTLSYNGEVESVRKLLTEGASSSPKDIATMDTRIKKRSKNRKRY